EKSLAKDDTLSAMPSMIPSCAGPAPSDVRKAGRTQYAISLAVSLRSEVRPKAKTFRGVDWAGGGGGASMSVYCKYHGTEELTARHTSEPDRRTRRGLRAVVHAGRVALLLAPAFRFQSSG